MGPVYSSAGRFAAFLPEAAPCQTCAKSAVAPVETHSPAGMLQELYNSRPNAVFRHNILLLFNLHPSAEDRSLIRDSDIFKALKYKVLPVLTSNPTMHCEKQRVLMHTIFLY